MNYPAPKLVPDNPGEGDFPHEFLPALERVERWFASKGWRPFDFQRQTWAAYLHGKSGLIHAPTGLGKTGAAWLGPVMEGMAEGRAPDRLRVLWLTPLRALAADTEQALRTPLEEMGIPWTVGRRTGDTSTALRKKLDKSPPAALVTTPESLSLLLSHPDARKRFSELRAVIVDEWHELMGSKRGVLAELALARLRSWRPGLRVWGLSATLGNMDVAAEVLLGGPGERIRGEEPKTVEIASALPDTMERFPWAGHLGLKLRDAVIREVESARSALVFTNTRSQTERWFQALLDARPEWAGEIALHHGSLDRGERDFVEAALREGRLRCVVCTSSLDLGVDFSPVDRVVQIGSPRGVARLLQRAGRSGHGPGRISRVLCVPTHALELVETAAARESASAGRVEPREPVTLALDVLAQHMVTVALSDGLDPDALFAEVGTTHAFRHLRRETFERLLDFVATGGPALAAYEEYARLAPKDGRLRVANPSLARRHRMSIGTITADAAVAVRVIRGKRLGTIEERFISRLAKGDRFVFAGQVLEFVRFRDMTVYVRRSKKAPGPTPQWMGGRMPLSTELAAAVRDQLTRIRDGRFDSPELEAVAPVMAVQARWSRVPGADELLMERLKNREGHHVFLFPFEGHRVHEGLAALLAFRLSRRSPISLSLAANDYGFELLSDRPIPVEEALADGLLSTEHLVEDILESLNAAEMAKRHFREIARIAGLVFQGYPGRGKSASQIQASSGLIYTVFREYDPENPLLEQAEREVLENQMDLKRLRAALERMAGRTLRIADPPHPTPLAFPIIVSRLRTRLSSETLSDRVRRMTLRLEKAADRDSQKKTRKRP